MLNLESTFDQASDANVASHTARLPAMPVPDGMNLLQVLVMFRHGDKLDPHRYDNVFPSYPIENLSRCFKLYPEAREGAPAGQGTPSDWEWKHGALTDLGHARLRHFGGQLRRAFIERVHFLSDAGPAPGDLYLWSRDKPRGRTWCSLQEVINGLWPSCELSIEEMGVEVAERDGCFVPVCPFPTFFPEDVQIIITEWIQRHSPYDCSAAERPVVKGLIEEARGLGRRGIMHEMMMRIAYSLQHGESLPPGFTSDDYCDVAKACHRTEIEVYAESEAMKKMYANCLVDIADSVQRSVGGEGIRKCAVWGDGPVPKLLLYASADTWVGPLAAVLGASYKSWPEPSCFLLLEVFSDAVGDTFVRLTRDSEVVGSFLSLPATEHGLVRWSDVLTEMQPLIVDHELQAATHYGAKAKVDMTTVASS